jgi:hypothetical protein
LFDGDDSIVDVKDSLRDGLEQVNKHVDNVLVKLDLGLNQLHLIVESLTLLATPLATGWDNWGNVLWNLSSRWGSWNLRWYFWSNIHNSGSAVSINSAIAVAVVSFISLIFIDVESGVSCEVADSSSVFLTFEAA